MSTPKNRIILMVLLPFLACCTKVIDLHLNNDAGKLVIEGAVSSAPGRQTIKLSRNVAVSNPNVYPVVSGAVVSVTDQNGRVFTFSEGTIAGTYTSGSLRGTPGSTYTMNVQVGTDSYKAKSVMPLIVPLDSLTFRDSEFNSNEHRKVLTVHYQDPSGVVNQYRFLVWVNQVLVKSVYVFNDDFSAGRYARLDLRVRDDNDDNFGIYSGDTVTVEMQCIDKPIYTYWYTLMQQGPNGPGGGVTPADPPSNITPSALGYFSAHSSQSRTVIVK